MFRTVSEFLEKWRTSPYRKPLIIQGARQVGKTYSVLNFGKTHYVNIAYFNFQTRPSLASIFEESLSPEHLIPILSHISSKEIMEEKTLIFFDEVQLCEKALTSLKYFCEEAPQYHIIAAGSLLGIAVNRVKFAFPVGKVDRYTMTPMTLKEFMISLGETELVNRIESSYKTSLPLPEILHQEALKLYKLYLSIGGMPETVSRYIETKDYIQVRNLQETIQMDYLDDMSKYQETTTEIKKTRLCYSTIATQLSKKNTRFQYKIIKTGARASEYENAISWLISGNLISQVFRVQTIEKPLENYKDIDDFKIFISDTGILCAQKDLQQEDILFMKDEIPDFKGGLTENYVNTQLCSNNIRTYYWRDEKNSHEIDFVINLDGNIIPIEVKSSKNVASDSLKEYIRKFKPEYSIRISEKNFGFENSIKSIPLYAVFCINNTAQ